MLRRITENHHCVMLTKSLPAHPPRAVEQAGTGKTTLIRKPSGLDIQEADSANE